jgi:hypothetical protein
MAAKKTAQPEKFFLFSRRIWSYALVAVTLVILGVDVQPFIDSMAGTFGDDQNGELILALLTGVAGFATMVRSRVAKDGAKLLLLPPFVTKLLTRMLVLPFAFLFVGCVSLGTEVDTQELSAGVSVEVESCVPKDGIAQKALELIRLDFVVENFGCED